MGFEIPLDVDYFHHPKTKHLVGLIGQRADIFPPRLWAWCCKYARNGVVRGGAAQIETAVDWDGEPGKLHAALIACGFVDRNGKTVHDFMLHTGRQVELYEKKKKKQRDDYAKKHASVSSGRKKNSSGRNGNSSDEELDDEKNSSGRFGNSSAYPEDPEDPEQKRKTERTKFARPTLDQIKAYCIERKNTVDPEVWFDHYTSNGWKVGKNAMKDWHAAVRKWERNDFGTSKADDKITRPVPLTDEQMENL